MQSFMSQVPNDIECADCYMKRYEGNYQAEYYPYNVAPPVFHIDHPFIFIASYKVCTLDTVMSIKRAI